MWQAIAPTLNSVVLIGVLTWLVISIVVEFLTWIDDREGTLFAKQGFGWLTDRLISEDGKKPKWMLAPYFVLELMFKSRGGFKKYSDNVDDDKKYSDNVDDDLDSEMLSMGWFMCALAAVVIMGLTKFITWMSGTTVLTIGCVALLVYIPFVVKRHVRCKKELAKVKGEAEKAATTTEG